MTTITDFEAALAAPIPQLAAVTDDGTLRPLTFDDYVGQDSAKTRLQVHIAAALARGDRLDHVLLVGPPGSGKTTLAHIIAGAMHQPMTVVAHPLKEADLLEVLYEMGSGILFIDEIHRWGRLSAQQSLLTLLEEGYLSTRWGPEHFPDVTVIAATTMEEKLDPAVKSRFRIRPSVEDYTETDMALIVEGMAGRAGVVLDRETALVLGRAAAGVPRNARSFVLAARDLALAGVPTTAESILGFCDTAPDGLTLRHMSYLQRLRDLGNRAGLETMSARLRLHPEAVKEIEQLLFDRRYIGAESRGRVLTAQGRRRLDGQAA